MYKCSLVSMIDVDVDFDIDERLSRKKGLNEENRERGKWGSLYFIWVSSFYCAYSLKGGDRTAHEVDADGDFFL